MTILDKIKLIKPAHGQLVIAVDGYGGSGKSTLAKLLADKLSAVVVHTDDFSRPDALGWDYERFKNQVLEPRFSNRAGKYQRFDWDTNKLAEWHNVSPDKILIIEGVSALRDELSKYWDYAIYVTCPYETRLARGVERDGEEMRSKWVDVWMPEEETYFQAQRPDLKADVVLDGTVLFNI
jgi:uridine kinase